MLPLWKWRCVRRCSCRTELHFTHLQALGLIMLVGWQWSLCLALYTCWPVTVWHLCKAQAGKAQQLQSEQTEKDGNSFGYFGHFGHFGHLSWDIAFPDLRSLNRGQCRCDHWRSGWLWRSKRGETLVWNGNPRLCMICSMCFLADCSFSLHRQLPCSRSWLNRIEWRHLAHSCCFCRQRSVCLLNIFFVHTITGLSRFPSLPYSFCKMANHSSKAIWDSIM